MFEVALCDIGMLTGLVMATGSEITLDPTSVVVAAGSSASLQLRNVLSKKLAVQGYRLNALLTVGSFAMLLTLYSVESVVLLPLLGWYWEERTWTIIDFEEWTHINEGVRRKLVLQVRIDTWACHLCATLDG